ncbi:histidinol phosphate phosphatase H [Neoconidiobolus thromboides FSU 785]|nr:histidinol phosphate phosphatase H [Neoconidiobolus thromboides FSU 785]
MPFSLHSHSGEFCHHGEGTLESMILKAIEKQYLIYGISEHVPRFNKCHFYPEEQDLSENDLLQLFQGYIREANRLKLKYQHQIEILIGAETENLGMEYLTQLKELLKENQVDYLVGSIHHVNNIPIDFNQELYNEALKTHNNNYETLFLTYFQQQYEMICQLKPRVIGHFDLIRLFCPKDKDYHVKFPNTVYKAIKRNIQLVVDYDGLFEINTAGFKKGLNSAYPFQDIISLILELKGKFTLSDDAHRPSEVGQYYNKELKEYLIKMKIKELYCFTKRNNKHDCEKHLTNQLELIKFNDWEDILIDKN